MDYGHHDLIHSHRVYRLQAVERRLNDYGTMMGNQVMMTVIHTPSSYNFLWKPRFHPVWCAFSAWLFFIHLALHALLTSFSQFAIIDPTSFVMLPVGERIGHYYRE